MAKKSKNETPSQANNPPEATLLTGAFQGAVPVNEPVVLKASVAEEMPPLGHPGWTDWVLDRLEPNEKTGRLPSTDGLRRFCREHFGMVVESIPRVVEAPNDANGHRATIEHLLTVVVYNHVPKVGGMTLRVGGAADAWDGNVKFGKAKPFATPVADKRSEGRAYVRLLGLVGVCTREETMWLNEGASPAAEPVAVADQGNEVTREVGTTEPAERAHYLTIDLICRNCNIDPIKYLRSTGADCKPGDQVPATLMVAAHRTLTEVQRRKNTAEGPTAADQKLMTEYAGYFEEWFTKDEDFPILKG